MALLHAISSPQPYAGYGDLIGVGRRSKVSPLIPVKSSGGATRTRPRVAIIRALLNFLFQNLDLEANTHTGNAIKSIEFYRLLQVMA